MKRTGLSHGCPRGTTPHCSAISRSKRCTCGHSGVSEGYVSPTSAVPTCEGRLRVVGEHGDELDAVARGDAEEGRDTAPTRGRVEDGPPELLDAEPGHGRPIERAAVARLGQHGVAHRPPSRDAAASRSRWSTGPGM